MVVSEFHNLDTKKSEKLFIKNYKSSHNPSILAYVIAIEMKQAEYSINPFSKLKTFNRSKKKLNKLIINYPENIHLRYIRLVIQEKTPRILGYNKYIKEDKHFLNLKLGIIDESDFLDSYIYNNTSI